MINLEYKGNPIVWKRPGYNHKTHAVYDQQTKEKEQIRWLTMLQYRGELLTLPLRMKIRFYMPIPKAVKGVRRIEFTNNMIHHTKRPDLDNLQKFILDCLTGIVYKDDSQICALDVEKMYGPNPCTLVELELVTHNIRQQTKADNHEVDFGED